MGRQAPGDRTWQGNECELGTRGFCGGGTVARRCSSGRCQSSGPPGPCACSTQARASAQAIWPVQDLTQGKWALLQKATVQGAAHDESPLRNKPLLMQSHLSRAAAQAQLLG